MALEQTKLFSLTSDVGQGRLPASEAERLTEQPPGNLSFAGRVYVYDGYALDGEFYVQRHLVFTPEEAGVFADSDPERVRLMVDAVGRNPLRQAEIRRYGKRPWHSVVRPERASLQALDWAFGHHVARVAFCLPHVEQLFLDDPQEADRWTRDLRSAYNLWCQGKRQSLSSFLRQKGVLPEFL